ncbi:MAG: 6-bladed beta-propeller, partial [Bacteroidales bacterium]|nr:6-bladed beta-propeller [Bacteroidales bacterium]
MKIKSILIYGFIASLLFSCQSEPKQVVDQNTYKAEFVDNIKLSDYFTSLDYVFLEDNPDGLFINADKILFFQDRWYILDRELQAIICFAEDGKFIFRIQTIGKGPGEYLLLTDIMINKTNKELWAQ